MTQGSRGSRGRILARDGPAQIAPEPLVHLRNRPASQRCRLGSDPGIGVIRVETAYDRLVRGPISPGRRDSIIELSPLVSSRVDSPTGCVDVSH